MNPPSSPCCPSLNHWGLPFYVLITTKQKTMIFYYRSIWIFLLNTQGSPMNIAQVITFFSFRIPILWSMGRICHFSCFHITKLTDWLWLTVALVVAELLVQEPSGYFSVYHVSGIVNYTEATIYFYLSPHENWGLFFSLATVFFLSRHLNNNNSCLRICENYGYLSQSYEPMQTLLPACITKFGFQFRESLVTIAVVSPDVILKSHTSPITNDYLSNLGCWMFGGDVASDASAGKALGKPHQIK